MNGMRRDDFVGGVVWASEQADREPSENSTPDASTKVPASVALAAEEIALVEIVATWLEQFMPTPYVPFSDRIGLARTILAAGFRKADREPSNIRANVRNLTGTTDEELTELGGFRGEPSDAEVRLEAATWALIERDTDTSDRGVSEEHYRERRAEVELVAALLAAQEVRRG